MMANKYDLTTNELLLLNSEMKHVEKSLGLAYLMLLGGHLGLHRFYLRKFVTGSLQLVLFILATIAYFSLSLYGAFGGINEILVVLIFIFLVLPGLALLIWIIVDLFLLKGMVFDWNRQAEERVMQQLMEFRQQKNNQTTSV